MPFDQENVQKPTPEKQTLLRDDFIEFILRHTSDATEFRLYIRPEYMLVGIDLVQPNSQQT